MKTKTAMLNKIVLGVFIAVSMAACNNAKTTNAPATTAPPAAEKDPIVYVNSDSLLSKYDYAKDMSKRLNDKGTTAKSNIESRGQGLQREIAEYQRGVSTMAADVRQKTEQRLQREQQEFQSYQQNEQADFQSAQSQENNKLYDKISDFAKQYAKEKGYKLVLTFSKANPTVLYGDPALDVTADVVKRLNDAYAKEKK
jgi:outer membrane protein